ncbi:MAG TPA: tRNA (adenosine(37)-N6)-dimethylallyltransferase MiaA [Clostridiales bacterium]|nr:MAG: tRNA (adenosine(37)-N6)-dimethylallyltransferase MiaA [Clostridiales bacterium GWD2_32_59]HAN09836.1 tRNA (adenosine(37)-N6)-dimethylallyltransferase MiaA [Clostridiales bacterium]
MCKRDLIVIGGPTASGKTDVSVELAKRISGEIISADSIQVYMHMNIGSAKVSNKEMKGVFHYLIDEIAPDEEFNIAIFKQKAEHYIEKIYTKDKIPIIVGGTGFYVQSVLKDVEFAEMESDYELRRKLENEAKTQGNEYVHDMLKQIDEVSARNIHPNNLKRVIRAIEYYKITGQPISIHNEKEKTKVDIYNTKYFVLNMDRETLYDRINRRVDIMMSNGLIDEVKMLLNMGYHENLTSMQGIGYKEVVDYIKGNISFEIMVSTIKQNTRNFAKRQLTWYKNQTNAIWIDVDKLGFDTEKIMNEMLKRM